MPKSSQKKLDYNKEYNRKNGYANQARYHETHPSKTYDRFNYLSSVFLKIISNFLRKILLPGIFFNYVLFVF